jgi:hypothetical protein
MFRNKRLLAAEMDFQSAKIPRENKIMQLEKRWV